MIEQITSQNLESGETRQGDGFVRPTTNGCIICRIP